MNSEIGEYIPVKEVKFYKKCKLVCSEKEKYINGDKLITDIQLEDLVSNTTQSFNSYCEYQNYV